MKYKNRQLFQKIQKQKYIFNNIVTDGVDQSQNSYEVSLKDMKWSVLLWYKKPVQLIKPKVNLQV